MRSIDWRVPAALGAGLMAMSLFADAASAADYFRHSHRAYHRRSAQGIYRDDRVCPRYEPADYRPRLVGQPLCYAARPYGLSQHLYDYSLDVQKPDVDRY